MDTLFRMYPCALCSHTLIPTPRASSARFKDGRSHNCLGSVEHNVKFYKLNLLHASVEQVDTKALVLILFAMY